MKPALYHDLRPAGLHRLADLLQDLFFGKQIRILLSLAAEKRAEPALILTDVGIIDIPVDDKRNRIAEPTAPHRIGLTAELDRVAMQQKPLAFLCSQSHRTASFSSVCSTGCPPIA